MGYGNYHIDHPEGQVRVRRISTGSNDANLTRYISEEALKVHEEPVVRRLLRKHAIACSDFVDIERLRTVNNVSRGLYRLVRFRSYKNVLLLARMLRALDRSASESSLSGRWKSSINAFAYSEPFGPGARKISFRKDGFWVRASGTASTRDIRYTRLSRARYSALEFSKSRRSVKLSSHPSSRKKRHRYVYCKA